MAATLVAALLAAACSELGSLPQARQAALPETLTGLRRWTWERYLVRRRFAHGRWSVLQAAGIAAGVAALVHGGVRLPLALAVVVLSYLLALQLVVTLLRASPERLLPLLVELLYPLGVLAMPLADPISFTARALSRSVGSELPPPLVTETEVELLVSEGEQSGALDHDQSEMIRNVLEFGDTQACDLMVPRTHVAALDVDTPIDDVLDIIKEKEHSRYPVYRDRIDNIVGVLHLKDLFLSMSTREKTEVDLESLLRKPVFVPATQLASSVLREMRAGRHHMAVVVDEYGGMNGLLTLEDLLEEIVGDIQDEYDDEEPPIVALPNGHFVVDASVPIAELNRQAGIGLPDDGDYNSLGGYIVEVMGRVPEPGAMLDRVGHRFVIKTADERHITKVEIMPQDSAEPELRAAG